MLQKTLSWVIWGGLALILFVPTIISSSMFFPFITGKAFLFRSLVEIIFAAWLCLALLDHSYRPKKSWVLIALAAFGLVVGLADIFGVHPLRSFWSNYERMEGFITILHLVALFFVAGSFIKKEKHWSIFWNASLGVSFVLALKGFSEIGEGTGRIDATLGNSTYFAVYLLFHVFLALWLLYKNRAKKAWVVSYLVVLAALLPAIYFTGTRGTVLGLLIALIVASGTVLLFGKTHPNARRLSAGLLILVVVGIGMFFALRNTAFVQDSPLLSRIANISLQDTTTQSRITLWTKIAIPAFKERPLLGWGQDNFIVVFGKYYDPVMWKQEPWFDRAHNVFVDWLMASGLLGLLAYLFLFGAGVWMLWKTHLSIPEKATIIGLFTGYAVHNFFVFDSLVSYIFFILVLAWVHALYVHRDDVVVHVVDAPKPTSVQLGTCVGIGVLGLALVWMLNVNGMVRAQTLLSAIRAERTEQNVTKSAALYEKALGDGWLGRYETREQYAQTIVRVSAALNNDERLVPYQERVIQEFQDGISEDPDNTRQYSFLAFAYRQFGMYDEAVATLQKALSFNGSRQIFLYDLAEVYALQKKTTDVIATYQHAFEVDTTNTEALGYYTTALTQAGRKAEADALLEQYGSDSLEIVGKKYVQEKRFAEAAAVYESIIATGNADAEIYATLALVYLELKQNQDALRIFEELDRLYPGAYGDQVTQAIQAIKDGKQIKIQ